MFERYPRESVQVLLLAKASALAAGEEFIDSTHVLAGACERHSLVESAMRAAAADDSPLSHKARLELHVVPGGIS